MMFTYYASPSTMTQAESDLAYLPNDLGALCKIVQGLITHPAEAHHYGVRFARPRWRELALRDAAAKLQRIVELSDAPLTQARPPKQRLLGNCRDFALLLCTILRAQGQPARLRYGFAIYFHQGFFTDHVICESWQAGYWVRVDAMLDDILRRAYAITCNPLALTDGDFLHAGRVWQAYRAGQIAAEHVGLTPNGPSGLTFIREGMLHDLASLNKVEPLCQDEYPPDSSIDWDHLADLLNHCDTSLPDLQAIFAQLQ